VIGWNRGRPARNEREARKPIGGYLPKDCALSARLRRNAHGSSNHLIGSSRFPKRILIFISGLLSCITVKVDRARRSPIRRAITLIKLGFCTAPQFPRTLGRLNPDSLKSTKSEQAF
jgi:hypothetical protein